MKIIKVLILMFILLFPTLVSARIGETLEQCKIRYGEPFSSNDRSVGFSKNGFMIMVTFYQNKADSISYVKEEKDSLNTSNEISENEINILLKNNSNIPWVEQKYQWDIKMIWKDTKDGKLISCYNLFKHHLMIMSKEYIERINDTKNAKEKKQLEEF